MALKQQLVLVLVLIYLGGSQAQAPLDWWQKTVFYQIYPRSFQDSDANGIGDLAGITAKLQHFKDMGVDAIWMSPIFKSPMVDFGYDISDFFDVDPLFGTMADFDAMMAKAKELGIKIVLDFVANHSSDQHEWFQKSLLADPLFMDHYVWKDSKGLDVDGNQIPPNNWVSVFGGPAWTYREERQKFYLHQFDPKQPDLNYRNPTVASEMERVLTFWMDRGVDGFRVDAIPHQFEIMTLDDEPLTGYCQPDEYCYLDHIYTKNLPETYDIVKRWRTIVDQYSFNKDNITRVLMTEAYAPIDLTMDYYGTPEEPGAHFTFNFQLINALNNVSTAHDYVQAVHFWMDNMRDGFTPNWVIGNHDQKRSSDRYGRGLEDGMNMLVMLLPGVAVTYYGEEIGMENTFISWEDTVDPPGVNAGPDRYQEFSRDPERTPYQWDNTLNAGFSMNTTRTWLPVNPNYLTLNLAAQKVAPVSHYNVYKRLVEARATPTVQQGRYIIEAINDNVLMVIRYMAGMDSYITVINVGLMQETVDLTSVATPDATVFTASIDSNLEEGSVIMTNAVVLPPRAAVVLLKAAQKNGSARSTISLAAVMVSLLACFARRE